MFERVNVRKYLNPMCIEVPLLWPCGHPIFSDYEFDNLGQVQDIDRHLTTRRTPFWGAISGFSRNF